MPIVEIDGIGRVELGGDFLKKSPQERDAIIQQIVTQVGGSKAQPAAGTGEPDTSFTSAFMSGIDAPLENLGTTAQAVGFNKTGKFLKDLTAAPKNYSSASDTFINKGGEGFNWTELPRAAVEQGGQIIGSLLTRAGGAAAGGALGAVAGPGGAAAGAAAGGFAAPALFGALQVVGPVALERAKNNGRTEPSTEDWEAAVATAGASGALDAFGVGKLFKGGSLLGNVAREGVTEGLQSVAEQAGQTAGTDKGLEIDPKQALGEGIIGAGASGGSHVAGKVAAVPGQVAGAVREGIRRRVIEEDYNNNPEQVASELRVQELYEKRKATVAANGQRVDQQPDSVFFKSVADDLETNLRNASYDLLFAGTIDRQGRGIILDAISEAKRHNREPGRDGASVGYFDTAVDRVGQLDLAPDTIGTLQNALRDLNTATSQNKQKNMRGPYEVMGKRAGALAATASAGALPFTGGASIIGLAAPQVGARIGRGIDAFLGTRTTDLLRTAEARAKYAKARGIEAGDTVADVKSLQSQAQGEAQARAERRAKLNADFQKTRADLRAKDIVPPGGLDALIHQHLGLKPSEVDKGLSELLKRGEVDQATVDAFHNSPRDLMEGNQGLALQNRLIGLVHEGVISSEILKPGSPQGSPAGTPLVAPQAPAGESQPSTGIRNPIAYKATVDAAMRLNEAIQASPDAHPEVKAAAAEIAAAKSKGEKLTILNQLITQVPEQNRQQVMTVLMPLTGYGATDGAASGVLRAPRWTGEAPQPQAQPEPTSSTPKDAMEAPAAQPSPDVKPGAIRIRGRSLVVSEESFDRIKAKKPMREALKASNFETVETRDGKRSLKL